MKVALVAGGTGLVGSQLLQLLVSDSRYDKVKCLTRRTVPVRHPKIETIITDGNNLKDLSEELIADDVFCCLGTTMKKAKSKEAFKKVDFDYPLSMATITKEKGATQFFLVSSLGADSNSNVFYNKVKGEIEHAISDIGFKALHIFRPSLLLGSRNEERSGEDGAKLFFKVFGFLVPAKYKAIDAGKVARAMQAMAKKEGEGKFIHESVSLQQF